MYKCIQCKFLKLLYTRLIATILRERKHHLFRIGDRWDWQGIGQISSQYLGNAAIYWFSTEEWQYSNSNSNSLKFKLYFN